MRQYLALRFHVVADFEIVPGPDTADKHGKKENYFPEVGMSNNFEWSAADWLLFHICILSYC